MAERARGRPWRIRTGVALAAVTAVAACGASSGIVPLGPNTYSVYEMRAEAIGGGARAHDAVLVEAEDFCRRQGGAFALLNLQPGGDPRGTYWPTAFTAIFQCVAASPAASSRPAPAG